MYIGKKIKELRSARGLSLTDLSQRCGVQIATLSRLENQKMTGTLESHMAIAKALGVELPELYTHVAKEEKKIDIQVQHQTGAEMFIHSEKSSYEILTNKVMTKKMMPVLLRVEPGGRSNLEVNKEGTECFIFVLEGHLDAVISGEKYSLAKNNTIYFDASQEHYFSNSGKTLSRALCVTSPMAL